MPRQARNLIDGGHYHVLNRGNNRRALFLENQDFRVFVNLTAKYLGTCSLEIYHYCLMSNHIHLLLRAPLAQELPRFMQGLAQSFAHYFKKKYGSVGFAYQNRYKSLLIDKESYLLEAARYIERNPNRAGIEAGCLHYPWSSIHYYISGKKDNLISHPNPYYLSFGKTESERQKNYKEFIGIERPYDSLVDEVFSFR